MCRKYSISVKTNREVKSFIVGGRKKKKNKQQSPHFLSPLARPRKTHFVQWYKRKTGPAQDLYKDATREKERKPITHKESHTKNILP